MSNFVQSPEAAKRQAELEAIHKRQIQVDNPNPDIPADVRRERESFNYREHMEELRAGHSVTALLPTLDISNLSADQLAALKTALGQEQKTRKPKEAV